MEQQEQQQIMDNITNLEQEATVYVISRASLAQRGRVHLHGERTYNLLRIREDWMQIVRDQIRINSKNLYIWGQKNKIIVHAPEWTTYKYIWIDTTSFLSVMRRKFNAEGGVEVGVDAAAIEAEFKKLDKK